MNKFLALISAAIIISFTGCTSMSIATESNAPAEKDVSTYLVGDYMDADAAKGKLVEAGFEVLAAYKVDKKGIFTTIVFTNNSLKVAADKPNRGFAAVLRLLVDSERKVVSISNPVYFGKAFLQDDYKHADAAAIQKSLTEAFGPLKGSAEKMQFDELAGYHFMMGMPYYNELDILGEGDNTALIEKAQKYKKGKLLVFELKLSDERTLLGYELGSKTSKFVKKIGTQNAGLLPYTVLIEDGKAKSLAAKYYIAVSYPLLTMSEFMNIATVPGAIEKDLKKPFK